MDIICFSHLRWNFVYQRPQHLMSRMAQHFRVFFVEEAVTDVAGPYLDTSRTPEGVWVVVPHLPEGLTVQATETLTAQLIQEIFIAFEINDYLFWYYTPMALPFGQSMVPQLIVYDCMDELSAFRFAPAALKEREEALMEKADIVFTGGHSLFEAKKHRHDAIFPFPSSIDKEHFGKARKAVADPLDQYNILHPRIGYYGVIDERIDLDLLEAVAKKRPEWNFVMLGPTAKIDPGSMPAMANIYYLGVKQYEDLPAYLSGWDVAMMPFAINESTRYISPTKTPEYLAGGRPVVSTPITDVINPYGEKGLVYIADDADEFIQAIENALDMPARDTWLKSVDAFLANESWDQVAGKMIFHLNTMLDVGQPHTQKIQNNV